MFQCSPVDGVRPGGRVFACLAGVLDVLGGKWGGEGVFDIQRGEWGGKCLKDVMFGLDFELFVKVGVVGGSECGFEVGFMGQGFLVGGGVDLTVD